MQQGPSTPQIETFEHVFVIYVGVCLMWCFHWDNTIINNIGTMKRGEGLERKGKKPFLSIHIWII